MLTKKSQNPHHLLRHIRRAHQASVKQFHHDSLLACYSGHSSTDALELAFGDEDEVAELEVDVGRGDGDDVGIGDGGQADEVVHRGRWDDERWILGGVGLEVDGMIVVEGEQGDGRCCAARGRGGC